ncbi:MAG: ATP-dependent DNA helicase RecG, partial [Gammaproteobacteria bacterium]|nr:ATP-dependent DNA helicase RecG [Gammaproteobacteria bacterium]
MGPQLSAKLAKLGISTLTDLLFHLPTRYEDRTTVTPLGAVRAGAPALVAGEVLASQVHQGRRRMLIVMLGDGTGQLALRFFHFSNSQREALRTGVRLRCFGDVRRNGANLEMVHPEFHFLRAHEDESETADTTLTAIYPLTEGISQGQLRKLVAEALDQVSRAKLLTELLPDECIEALQFPELLEAIEFVH